MATRGSDTTTTTATGRLQSLAAHMVTPPLSMHRVAAHATDSEESPRSAPISSYGTSKNVDPLLRQFAKFDIMANVVELECADPLSRLLCSSQLLLVWISDAITVAHSLIGVIVAGALAKWCN